jgi:glycolate oxidase iron-sulfur subunit
LLAAEYANMLACVRCGLCLTSCPTYVLSGNEAEGPRGRIAMMRGLVETTLPLTADLIAHEQNCLVCDACTAVCPAGVHMAPLQVALRAHIAPRSPLPLPVPISRQAAVRGVFADLRQLRLLVRALALYQRLGLRRAARRWGLLRLLGLATAEALLPPLGSARTFVVPRGQVYPAEGEPESTPGAGSRQVALFAGCVMSTALAKLDWATIRVLQRAGWSVILPRRQGCCGALHAHGGDLAGALALARRNIAAFEAAGSRPHNTASGSPEARGRRPAEGFLRGPTGPEEEGAGSRPVPPAGGFLRGPTGPEEEGAGNMPIVVNSAGCGAMLKDYASYLRADPAWAARARAFSARVHDLSEILTPGDLPFRRPLVERVTYQDPCHLVHAQRIAAQPRALLRAIPGVELREMAESTLCCGSAGIYNLTHPRESRALRERRLDQAAATGATTIVTANPGCYLHLQSGLAECAGGGMGVKHLVELLDEATAPVPREERGEG